jgi:hypothetical protein
MIPASSTKIGVGDGCILGKGHTEKKLIKMIVHQPQAVFFNGIVGRKTCIK